MLSSRKKGDIAENVSVRFLLSRKFKVISRNYKRAGGEIDIVATKDSVLHIFEVKSALVSHSVSNSPIHRVEENVHDLKLHRLRHTIRRFLSENGRCDDGELCFHVLCVYMDLAHKKAHIKWIKNVIL